MEREERTSTFGAPLIHAFIGQPLHVPDRGLKLQPWPIQTTLQSTELLGWWWGGEGAV